MSDIAWETCLVEAHPDRSLEKYARKRMGILSPSIEYFAPVPWLARAVVDWHTEYGLLMHLDQDVADLVALVVSQENSCRFCYAATRMMLWGQGMSQTRIQRIEQDLSRADLPPRTAAAIDFGRRQSRTGPTGARAAREMLRRAGFGNDELKEVAFAVATTDFNNRAHTIPAIPARPLERLPDALHVRLFRPLLGRVLKSRRLRGRATEITREPTYTYGHMVKAFAGSPIAPALADTLESMWASPHLTRRCKLLMFAIVARGLDCPLSGRELAESLQAEGMSPSTIAQVLTHLDAPELDEVERLLVPFARETIWYQPGPLQRRARALRGRLSDPQLLEAVGVVALANALCRMGAMISDD